jgi:protein TonB
LTPLKTVQPKYPAKADRDRLEGWVELDFTVTDSGEVKDVAVHGASAPGVFEQAASEALSQWRYRPVLRDGKPVAQRARIRVRFKPG